MTQHDVGDDPGLPRQSWRSRLKSRVKAPSVPLRVWLIVLVAGLAILTLSSSVAVILHLQDRLRTRHARDERALLLDRVCREVISLTDTTLYGVASLKMKYTADGKVTHQFVFIPDKGMYITNSAGGVVVQLLDADGFLLHSEWLTDFTRLVDGSDASERCIGLTARGDFSMPLKDYSRIAKLDVPHGLRTEALPLNPFLTPQPLRLSDMVEPTGSTSKGQTGTAQGHGKSRQHREADTSTGVFDIDAALTSLRLSDSLKTQIAILRAKLDSVERQH